MPSSHARFALAAPNLTPCVRRPSGNFDSACRRSSVTVMTPRSVTRTLPCQIAESHHFSPRLSEVWHVWWMRERGARLRVLRVLSEYPSPLTLTQNENAVAPRGGVLFCFRVPVGYLVPPWGPPPYPGPAVHSNGHTALHEAAVYGNRRIVRLLVASGADVNAEDDDGCAVSACGRSA